MVSSLTDDTYVNVPNLASFVQLYNESTPHIFGEIYRYKGYRYPHGGAGWLLSKEFVARMVTSMDRFIQMCNQTNMWADDVVSTCVSGVFGLCMGG
jgi:hypothetical protein